MGEFWDYDPPPPEVQHIRLEPLRRLVSRGIPSILWAEDVLYFVHKVPTHLFDQQIIVPDPLIESASAVLQEGPYIPAVSAWDYVETNGPHKGASPFPGAIRLKRSGVPDNDTECTADHIVLLPQSYFGFDSQASDRFQSLVPPLDTSNAGILIPKYNTMLEGLVHFIINPPTGLENPHRRGKNKHDIFIGYLLDWRVRPDFGDVEVPPPKVELLPEEKKILSELTTDDARWYIGHAFWKRHLPKLQQIKEYKQAIMDSTSGSPTGPGATTINMNKFKAMPLLPSRRPFHTSASHRLSRDSHVSGQALSAPRVYIHSLRRSVGEAMRFLRRILPRT